MSIYSEGDHVRLRMSSDVYPATITRVCDYVEHHGDGTVCQQYKADVQFPQEMVRDGLISECMILGLAKDSEDKRMVYTHVFEAPKPYCATCGYEGDGWLHDLVLREPTRPIDAYICPTCGSHDIRLKPGKTTVTSGEKQVVGQLWRVETYAEEDRGDVSAVEAEEHSGSWWLPSSERWIRPGEYGAYNYYTSEEAALRNALDMLRGDLEPLRARIAEYESRLAALAGEQPVPPNTPGMLETWRYRLWSGHLWRRKHFALDERGHSYPEWEDMGAINDEGYIGDGARMPQPYQREEREN